MPDPDSMVVKLAFDMTEYNEMLDAAVYSIETGQLTEIEAQDTLYAFIRVKQEVGG